jgi:hypothetical protein
MNFGVKLIVLLFRWRAERDMLHSNLLLRLPHTSRLLCRMIMPFHLAVAAVAARLGVPAQLPPARQHPAAGAALPAGTAAAQA